MSEIRTTNHRDIVFHPPTGPSTGPSSRPSKGPSDGSSNGPSTRPEPARHPGNQQHQAVKDASVQSPLNKLFEELQSDPVAFQLPDRWKVRGECEGRTPPPSCGYTASRWSRAFSKGGACKTAKDLARKLIEDDNCKVKKCRCTDFIRL